ncbi:hypothetical protein N658DRAFT_496510 [Parathielavia hyrcaniae]|uniref:Uncharacterized protein n=1 Tax=Parathielavia hyrcaniae TaxID=113614 RepID=A0AAN6Q2T4_9PEZI|nr:hypothetical protein N658DRAFT_496510 [Parathielavia hyrcaniae]
MAPNTRPPGLPSIPDFPLDLDEKMHLLPELDEILSSTTGESSATLEEDDCRPSRSHSTRTHNSVYQRRVFLPSRFPSVSSDAHTTTGYTTLPPLSPRRYDQLCQPQPLQLPPFQKFALESWTITYHHPTPPPRTRLLHLRALGISLFRQLEDRADSSSSSSSILSVVPNTHFSQAELAATVALHRAAVVARAQQHRQGQGRGWKWEVMGLGLEKGPEKGEGARRLRKPRTEGDGKFGGGRSTSINTSSGDGGGDGDGDGDGDGGVGGGSGWGDAVYAADVEKRIRKLDWKVQDEIYELLSDRVQSSSNAFRRREWRVVVLTEVPGGELTDSPTGFEAAGISERSGCFPWAGARRSLRMRMKPAPAMPITEYRLVLRGTEVKANDQGWGYFNRYSRPWREADEKEVGEKRRWSSATGRSEKYVDF